MNDKHTCAEKLYDALGNISDEYIFRAEAYRQNHFRPQKVLSALAACIAILICISSAVRMMSKSNDLQSDLQAVLLNCEAASTDVSQIDLFDGEKKLVWLFDGSYYTAKLSNSEYRNLNTVSKSNFETAQPNEDISISVWLCDGNGLVTSPYLHESSGNAYCKLFDYKAEIVPNEKFTSLVYKYII